MDKQYILTVAVMTYQSSLDKILLTLRSILLQQDLVYQIVVSDDGSVNNHFHELEAFFVRYAFRDYVLVSQQKNQGIVRNVLLALSHSKGKYIKLIAPGDCLYGDNILHDWIKNIEERKAVLSFCPIVCYQRGKKGKVTLLKEPVIPYDLEPYRRGGAELRKWYLLGNYSGGPALILNKDVFWQYLSRFSGKVIYCEDQIYQLMLYQNEPAAYFDQYAVLYEFGEGISTAGSDAWTVKLQKDVAFMRSIMRQQLDKTKSLDRKICAFYDADENPTLYNRIRKYFIIPELIPKRMKRMFNRPRCAAAYDQTYLKRLFHEE